VVARNDQLRGAAIVEAASLISARQFDAESAARVPPRYVGRVLSRQEAAGALDKIARGQTRSSNDGRRNRRAQKR